MPMTLQEVENVSNLVLDHHMRGEILSQTIQDKPLLKALREKQKTFPGGKGLITGRVKNDYTTQFMGFSDDDTVTYGNPANVKQFSYPYFELHAGIRVTMSELKKAGITVVDSLAGEETSQATESEKLELANLLDDKLEDMSEGTARSLNSMLWLDGSQSAKVIPGVLSQVRLDPTTGVVGGIDCGGNPWWRNLTFVGASRITASPSLQTLTKTLRAIRRSLLRYGAKIGLVLCGSAFLAALESEVHEKGIYSQSGFGGKQQIGMGSIALEGIGTFQYDPTLDDMGMSKFCFMLDTTVMQLMVMSGDDFKKHAPARPPEKYVIYRAVTLTAALINKKLNAHAVIEVA